MPVAVFGGGAVQTAYVSFTALDITSNSITLVWTTSYFNVPSVVDGIHYDVLAASMTVNNALANTNTITLPDATESSVGSNFIITNIGMSAFRLLTSDGAELIVIPNTPNTSNSFWVQLTDNSTPEGTWKFVQFGAGTSQAQASTLAGNGLVALSGLLNTNISVKFVSTTPYTVITSDRAKLLLWNTGTGSMILPGFSSVPAGYYISVNNEGSGVLTISGDVNIDNNPSITVSQGQSLSIISSGTRWWTLGFGQNASSTNFAPGSALAPSITFANDSTTGIYYYSTAFPPVIPPGIGFSVESAQIANLTAAGLFLNSGKSITIQDSSSSAKTNLSSNAAYGQLSWNVTGLTAPATFRISGTNTETTVTLGPFAGLSISQGSVNANISYNNLTILVINNLGSSIFPLGITFQNTITVELKSTFNGISEFNASVTFNEPVTFLDTVTFNPPIPISSGGTGQNNQQAALNALMPTAPAIGDLVYRDATNNWVRLPIGTAGQVLTVVNSAGNLIPQWV